MSSCTTISLVIERRPCTSFEAGGRGSWARRFSLVVSARLSQWRSHFIGSRPAKLSRDLQSMNARGGKHGFVPKSTCNMIVVFHPLNGQNNWVAIKAKIYQSSDWDIHICMSPNFSHTKKHFVNIPIIVTWMTACCACSRKLFRYCSQWHIISETNVR